MVNVFLRAWIDLLNILSARPDFMTRRCLGRNSIIALKEENGTHIHDRDRMIKRCEEFYNNLYSTKLAE